MYNDFMTPTNFYNTIIHKKNDYRKTHFDSRFFYKLFGATLKHGLRQIRY
jgi:Ni,Fe-hydrogenase I small subunit